ncbi:MAG: acyl carrier protein [Lachnospiraceae bacterium]|nr:acyl carrier protein [Lachnospiraceae bacterium]
MNETVFKDLQTIIADVLNCNAEEIKPETSFVNDLGADSLDVYQIIMSVEEKYNISISPEAAEGIRTVGDANEAIQKAL